MEFLDTVRSLALAYGLNILGAIVILVAGYWLAGWLARMSRKALGKTKTDEALVRFAGSLIYYAVLIFVVLAALNRLGIQTTSFVALVGAAGLAIGLALEGALSNFAAGVLLLLFRPFKIGDLVEIADHFGSVEEILIFSTILVTLDNKTVTIPNSQVTGSPIVNYSKKGLLRLDMVFGIGYGDDLLKAKRVLQELVTADPRVATDPAPIVAVTELGDSSVNFAVRPYVTPADYWNVYFDLTERVKLRFDAEGISIPFPQRDVHLFKETM
ncbi:MAG: mechanosensitive ion channel [Ardenticatenaceae bacterium]|nr:mechanosensitive ion channel [Anaerolineales bacterium]MCB8923859.1 mechanosensitive ion channel [Ardenticatenaceae bacterium]MCB9003362.1 mechanosensitive ion channel [Ardenticatenaceae bacterium]